METKRYYSSAVDSRTAIAYPSSEFVELAGKIVKLQCIEHNGVAVADTATRIKQAALSPEDEIAVVREWLRWEFNLPATVRAHCGTCFIRVFTNEEFYQMFDNARGEVVFRERSYQLHWQSRKVVCLNAPLIAVSFRVTPEGEYFAVAQVWAARDSKTLIPTTNSKE